MDYEEILKKYRLAYTKYTNQTTVEGRDEFPVIPCELDTLPDYLCLYCNPKDYNLTAMTCVCFYEFDSSFDSITGLFNAIYYDDFKLLQQYKERFKDVKMIIEPDYSQVRDIEVIENKYRQFKARVVGLWFMLEMKIPVIPNINYAGVYSFDYMLEGIRNCKVLAISLKGIMDKVVEEEILKQAIEYVVDHTKVKTIVCYSTSDDINKINDYFKYAISKGIKIHIPNNSLLTRNKILSVERKKNKLSQLI